MQMSQVLFFVRSHARSLGWGGAPLVFTDDYADN